MTPFMSKKSTGRAGTDQCCPFAAPHRLRKHVLVRAYFVLYGLDANSGAFLAGAGMILSGVGLLVAMHRHLGV